MEHIRQKFDVTNKITNIAYTVVLTYSPLFIKAPQFNRINP